MYIFIKNIYKFSEKISKILEVYNDELKGEFTEGGSEIAKIRHVFEDIEIKIRKLYGNELKKSLLNDELPECQENEDIKLINLEGQDFKMLIHGIDAYGAGTGIFEKREVGKTYLCTSLISEKHLKRATAARYYGFRNIGSNALVEEGCQDIYSQANGDNSLEVTAGNDMKFFLSEKLLELSDSYNEVVLWREYLGDNGQMQELKIKH